MSLISNLQFIVDNVTIKHAITRETMELGVEIAETEIKSLATNLQSEVDRNIVETGSSYEYGLAISRRDTLIEIIEELVGETTD